MSTPEQHAPPVHACAAGSVLHAHSADTLEPAVLLHTTLPSALVEALDVDDPRVDVHGDGPGSQTLTVRVLVPGHAVSWQLPVAPVVAALPGQLGDDGRMVLLAVVDGEPEPGFWARPADCERLAAELQLPVADLAEALRGRLTRWLADDLEALLHDDAHERALEQSPAQTVASALLAHYREDLEAAKATTRLVGALQVVPDEMMIEIAARLSAALRHAVEQATPEDVQAVRARTGPFEAEALRLLDDLPARLAAVPPVERTDIAMEVVGQSADRDEGVRAAVSVAAALARQVLGPGRDDQEVLRHLVTLDDRGMTRLARLWAELSVAVDGAPSGDGAAADALLPRVREEGPAGQQWLAQTAALVAALGVDAAKRQKERIAPHLPALERVAGDDSEQAALQALLAVLPVARYVRSRGGSPAHWLTVPEPAGAAAVLAMLVAGLDRDVAVDLLVSLLEDDVEAPDLLEGFVCATSQVLAELDPLPDEALRPVQVADLLGAVPDGPRGARWLLAAVLREAPEHDPEAADLRAWVPGAPGDPDRQAVKAGLPGTMRAGLLALEALAATFGEEAQATRQDVLGTVLPGALAEHDLFHRPA